MTLKVGSHFGGKIPRGFPLCPNHVFFHKAQLRCQLIPGFTTLGLGATPSPR